MALGGGTFLTQNKILPGTYINFISSARAEAFLSDRGYLAIAMPLDFGVDGEVFTVTNDEFLTDTLKLFGYSYTSDKLKGLRDLFKNVTTCYIYRLNSGTKATSDFGEAKHSGIRGNDIRLVIDLNIDDNALFDVTTYIDNIVVDTQTVATMADIKDNDFVVFNKSKTLVVSLTVPFTGGTNAEESNYAPEHQKFLEKIETYSFNAICAYTGEKTISSLYSQFTKRMRDEVGVKFQCVVYQNLFDYEGVVSLENKVIDAVDPEYSLLMYVAGIISSCKVNKSNTNKKYDGEYVVDTDYKQSDLETAIKTGKFIYHKVGDDVRVLSDINTLVTTTEEKGSDFKSNQTIRVLDQIGNDIAVLFNTKYLGVVNNDKSGRLSFWNDLVTHHKTLESIRAIEDFDPASIVVEKGSTKKSVVVYDKVMPTNAMEQLYMTTEVL